MTKKRLLLIASLPVAIAVAIGALAMLPDRPGVTKANFERIEVGMTLGEVEAIFGKGAFSTYGRCHNDFFSTWQNSDGSVARLRFEDNEVCGKGWHPSTETILEKIRRWLHIQ